MVGGWVGHCLLCWWLLVCCLWVVNTHVVALVVLVGCLVLLCLIGLVCLCLVLIGLASLVVWCFAACCLLNCLAGLLLDDLLGFYGALRVVSAVLCAWWFVCFMYLLFF